MAERHLSFERLEHRQLLAVTTSLANGTLTITGDDAADDIAIVGTAKPGELIVTGRNGTSVNGVPNGSVTAYPVIQYLDLVSRSKALDVDLGGGNDSIALDNYFAGSFEIDTGDGDDLVTIGQTARVFTVGDGQIATGPGNDRVLSTQKPLGAAGGLEVYLGAGHDVATLVNTSGSGRIRPWAFAVPAIFVHGGTGNDSILGIRLTSTGDVSLHGGGGANSLAMLYSIGRYLALTASYDADTVNYPGANTFYLDTNYSTGSINVNTYFDSGAPVTTARDSTVSIFACRCSVLEVTLGYGRNLVNLYANAVNGPPYGVFAGEPYIENPRLSIRSYSGPVAAPPGLASDTVVLSYNIATVLNVTLAGGNDLLALGGNFVGTSTTLDGGSGRNILGDRYNYFGRLTVRNFG
jgi:hypothetical protein